MVGILIDAGVNVNVRNEDNLTPLKVASMGGHTGVVRLLLEAGTNPNYCDGYSPLYWADSRGYTEMAQLLRSYGARK